MLARPTTRAARVQALLESAAAAPDAHIQRLNFVSPAERALVLSAFNATDAAPSEVMHRGQTVHGALEHWAAVQPDAPALVLEARARMAMSAAVPSAAAHRICRADASRRCAQGATMSYAELDARANQLAHRLVGLGVGPEVPVGVLMPRSLDLVVAMLGVLKAGGAYVPMDPAYPADRLAMMIEDTEVRRESNPARRCFTRVVRHARTVHAPDSLRLQASLVLSQIEVNAARDIATEARVLLVR